MPVPDVIGRYRVRERLSSGAYATVWLASDEQLDSLVAVKVLAENWAHHADVRTRFTQEAQIMRRADSDRLVRVFDVGELPDGRPYLVMTYAAGGTLADLLADGPLPVGVAVRMAADIARGVAVLHAAGHVPGRTGDHGEAGGVGDRLGQAVPTASAASADAGLVRVRDASGRLSIAVPAAWAKQFRDAGWDPGALGFPRGSAPGLVVGPDLAAWADPASRVPGVFAGLTPSLAAGSALPQHQDCVRQPERLSRLTGFDARVLRWTRCAGTPVSFSEVVLIPPRGDFGVYVQIKQTGGPDRTDDLLDRLVVR